MNTIKLLSKPALLKKGLRRAFLFYFLPFLNHCRNLPYLKRDCDIIQGEASFEGQGFESKPALLKKGLRLGIVLQIFLHCLLSRRNLPYLKRDCDPTLSANSVYLHHCSSKPALLKKGLRLGIFIKDSTQIYVVETCPT